MPQCGTIFCMDKEKETQAAKTPTHFALLSLITFSALSVVLVYAFYTQLPGFGLMFTGGSFSFAFIIGVTISALFSIIVYLLLSFRYHVQRRAGRITKELFESREWFRELYENAPVPYLMLSHEGRIRQPNKAAVRLYGSTADALYDALFFDLYHEEDIPDARQYFELFKRALPVNNKEIRIKRQDGTSLWVLLSIFIIQDRGKGEHYGLVTLVDITERKEIENAKTEFVSLASHQLRSPLSTAKWYLEAILSKDSEPLSPKQYSRVEKVYKGTQRMVELVSTFLNVSRIEMGTLTTYPKMVDVVHVSDNILEELSPEINEKNLEIQKNYDEVTVFYTDPKLFGIILQNLLSNAVKYTPQGGRVSVTLDKEGEFLNITVEDSGCGIPSEQHNQVFTKLFRTENAMRIDTGGTGLGLYITKSIVEKLNGTISFTSELNKGTTFKVELPMKKP